MYHRLWKNGKASVLLRITGGPNLFISVVVEFINPVFQITPISLKFGILNEKCWNFEKMLLISK